MQGDCTEKRTTDDRGERSLGIELLYQQLYVFTPLACTVGVMMSMGQGDAER